jgi:hypothetical protein
MVIFGASSANLSTATPAQDLRVRVSMDPDTAYAVVIESDRRSVSSVLPLARFSEDFRRIDAVSDVHSRAFGIRALLKMESAKTRSAYLQIPAADGEEICLRFYRPAWKVGEAVENGELPQSVHVAWTGGSEDVPVENMRPSGGIALVKSRAGVTGGKCSEDATLPEAETEASGSARPMMPGEEPRPARGRRGDLTSGSRQTPAASSG